MEAYQLGKDVLQTFLDGDVPPRETIALFASKMLSIAILAGACITKLPQLWNVYKSKSGEGLPLLSIELETYVYTVHVAYGLTLGLPVTAFGEAAVALIQTVALLGMLYAYKEAHPVRPFLPMAAISGVMSLYYNGYLSIPLATKMYDANSTVFLASRLPTIISAFREGVGWQRFSPPGKYSPTMGTSSGFCMTVSNVVTFVTCFVYGLRRATRVAGKTGQQSFFTNFLQFAGSAVRIFTSLQENAGPAMVRGFLIGTSINGLVVAQIMYYGKDGRGDKKKKKE